VQGQTSFVSEAAKCAVIPTYEDSYQLIPTDDNQSIKDFLSRPRAVFNGTISTGTGNTYTQDVGFTTSLTTLLGPTAANRLSGVAGIRAKFVWTLVVNATPFHQGLLNLNWQYATSGSAAWDKRVNQWPLTVNLPHVFLDIAEQTMVTLEVPFVSNYEYLPVSDTIDWEYGTLGITNLTDVRVIAGQANPTFVLYLSLQDIDLIGVTPIETSTAVLQAGPTSHDNSAKKSKPVPVVHKDSKITSEKKSHGLYSGLVGKVADVVSYSKYIPSLSAIGGTAEWFLRGASKGLEAFGYAKPVESHVPTRVLRSVYAGDTHIDIPSDAFVVGPFQGNTLAVTADLGCDDEDHMAFDYVLTKESYIYRGTMSTTQVAGTLLYGTQVSPSSFWYRDVSTTPTPNGNIGMPDVGPITVNCFLPSTLMYVANNFRMWRGDIKFRIKFAKTKMHGARVQLTYTPQYVRTPSSTAISTTIRTPFVSGNIVQPQGFSTIVDLRDGSDFEFIVPYVSPIEYTSFNSSIGSFTMHVVNGLVTPATASTSIDFAVFVSAMPGFELACICPSLLDGIGTGPTARLQDGLGGIEEKPDTSQLVIGERFNSIKQVIMVPDYATIDVNDLTTVEYVFTPWFKYNVISMVVPMPNNYTRAFFGAKSSRLARMYAFGNGGTMSTLFVDGGASSDVTITVSNKANDAGSVVTGFGNLYNKGLNYYSAVNLPEALSFFKAVIPTYSKWIRIPLSATLSGQFWGTTQDFVTTDGGPYDYRVSDTQTSFRIRNASGEQRRILYGRAAADDARLAQFIGPPAVVLWPSTKTVPPVSGNGVAW